MKLGSDTGSLVNHLLSSLHEATAPAIGMGATVLCWSDRIAGTICDVQPDGSITVQADKATRTDVNGMSEAQTYHYEPDPHGQMFKFAPVARGKAKGQLREDGRAGGYAVLIGSRNQYYDFSF